MSRISRSIALSERHAHTTKGARQLHASGSATCGSASRPLPPEAVDQPGVRLETIQNGPRSERCAPTQDTQRHASWFDSIPILGGWCEPAHHVFPPAGPRAVCRAWQLHSTIAARPRRRSHRVRRLPSTRLLSYSGPFMAQVKRLRHCSTSVSYLRDICCGHEATGGTELSLLRP